MEDGISEAIFAKYRKIFFPHHKKYFSLPDIFLLKLVVCRGPLDSELMASLRLYDGVRVMGPIPISATTVHNQEQNNPDDFSDNQNYYVERQEAD